ncbi:MAG: hypothetical protein ACLRZH_14465 [Ruthenibacterium lactatiformans]
MHAGRLAVCHRHRENRHCSRSAGRGRETKERVIDPAAGIRLLKKAGDPVKKGDVLARLYAGDAAKFAAAEEKFHSALTFAARRPQLPALVLARVDKDGVTRF